MTFLNSLKMYRESKKKKSSHHELMAFSSLIRDDYQKNSQMNIALFANT